MFGTTRCRFQELLKVFIYYASSVSYSLRRYRARNIKSVVRFLSFLINYLRRTNTDKFVSTNVSQQNFAASHQDSFIMEI